MVEIRGAYGNAVIFTDMVDATALSQLQNFCNNEITKDNKIRVMPDVHAGNDCVVGLTMTISNKAIPNWVGADIGCGVDVVGLNVRRYDIDYDQLEFVIYNYCAEGGQHTRAHKYNERVEYDNLKCVKDISIGRAKMALCTLGGGNHYIEIDQDDEDNLYLVVHSGSRYLGGAVAKYYQELGYKSAINRPKRQLIERLKAEGREKEIQSGLNNLPKITIPKSDAWVEGQDLEDYLHDMRIVTEYAAINRQAIIYEIVSRMKWDVTEQFTCTHNYIDVDNRILRKGAISAKEGEKLIIPLNMRDGALLCTGRGNPDWNCSAPHGAGRVYSRSAARERLNMYDFKKSMEGIWSKSVGVNTLDESPMAYKPVEAIVDNIGGTAYVDDWIKPVYNFKNPEIRNYITISEDALL